MLIEIHQACMIYVGVLQAKLQLLRKGKAKTVTVALSLPARLIPVQGGRPPPYFIFAGLVFVQATVPYLRSEYGKEFDFEAPVKLLVRLCTPGSWKCQPGYLSAACCMRIDSPHRSIVPACISSEDPLEAETAASWRAVYVQSECT